MIRIMLSHVTNDVFHMNPGIWKFLEVATSCSITAFENQHDEGNVVYPPASCKFLHSLLV